MSVDVIIVYGSIRDIFSYLNFFSCGKDIGVFEIDEGLSQCL